MKQTIDFSRIPEKHNEIDNRLTAWRRWVRVSPQLWGTQPMFRWARSNARQWEESPVVHETLNTLECHEIERAVSVLPDKHRDAIRLFYVHSGLHFSAMLRKLAVTEDTFAKLLHDGRCMLVNRLNMRMKTDDT